MNQLEITKMRPEEIEKAAELMVTALQENYITDMEIKMDIAYDENLATERAKNITFNQLKQLINDSNAGVFSAIYDGKFVGYAVVLIEGNTADFWDIVVDSNYRGMGIGGVLIKRIEEFAVSKGARIIFLDVNWRNLKAMNIYEKLGYRKISVIMAKGDMKNGIKC